MEAKRHREREEQAEEIIRDMIATARISRIDGNKSSVVFVAHRNIQIHTPVECQDDGYNETYDEQKEEAGNPNYSSLSAPTENHASSSEGEWDKQGPHKHDRKVDRVPKFVLFVRHAYSPR